MSRSAVWAVRTSVISRHPRSKEYLTTIRADEGVLALETLFFPDEIRNPADELDTLPGRASAPGKELDLRRG